MSSVDRIAAVVLVQSGSYTVTERESASNPVVTSIPISADIDGVVMPPGPTVTTQRPHHSVVASTVHTHTHTHTRRVKDKQ